MSKYLFNSDKTMYKANLHCHTTVSDGKYTPEEIKAMYKERGYSIVAFSDHGVLKNQTHLNDDGFLAINACEFVVNNKKPGDLPKNIMAYHFSFFSPDPGVQETPPKPRMDYHDTDAINKYIKDRSGEGFLVCYNHPYASAQTYEHYHRLEGCFAVEIYNNHSETGSCRGYNPWVYDEMLRAGHKGHKLFCISADDNHNKALPDSTIDSFGGFVMINSGALRYEDIIASLIRGDFYSSQGPKLYEISLDENRLSVKCSGVVLIAVYTDSKKSYVRRGTNLTEAGFELDGDEKYIRIMCRDKDGNDANSNAFWLI